MYNVFKFELEREMTMSKYKSVIEKITVNDATFKESSEREFTPSWINFFYGNNGTGKSTIARTIKKADSLSWKDNKSPNDFNVLVFNKDFIVKEMKFDDETPLMPGVLMLGKDKIETQKLVEEKQEQQNQLDTKIQSEINERTKKQTTKSTLQKRFEDACWKAAKRYKESFGGGKGDFRTQALCSAKVCKTVAVEHDFDKLKSLYDTATDPNAKRYDILELLNLSKLVAVESYALLEQPIVSTADNVYSRFWEAINAIDWVKQGQDRFSNITDGKCPYCQQGLPQKFEEQLAACFDRKYSEDCAKMADFGQKYASYMIAFIETVRRYIAYIPQEFGDLQVYKDNLALLEKTLEVNKQRIYSKIEKPSESINLDSAKQYLEEINKLIENTNHLFNKNNRIYDNKEKSQEICMNKVWELLSFELQNVTKKYFIDDKSLENEIKTISEQIDAEKRTLANIKSEISRLTDRLGGSVATIDKINNLLAKSGFQGFTLREHDKIPDKYVVVRNDGSTAKDLSEGERNFIAFLYFYYLVQGAWKKDDLIKGKIVVIDDPVSSMDSAVLFIVSSLVRKLINDCFYDGKSHNIKQIFILTHNPYFHKEVSFDRLNNEHATYCKVSFYEVKKIDNNVSVVKLCEHESNGSDPDVEWENYSPVQNSYTALWNEYKDAKLPTTLLSIIHRIIEYHFIQLCSYSIDELRTRVLKYFDSDVTKQNLAKDMLRFIYEPIDTIHNISDGIYFTANNDNETYKKVFKAIFDAMGQEQHYRKMSGE